MRTLHLCCGRGGSLWAGAILGWQSVAAVDHDEWRIECLRREAAAGWWPGLNAICADLTSDWHARVDGGVDLIAAGFSCRDISSAGSGGGITGKSTGPTYLGCLKAIDYFRPAWVFYENSPKIRTRGRSTVTADFVARGYRWRDGIIGATDVGAPHQRDRWLCLAQRADLAGERWPEGRPERTARHGHAEAAELALSPAGAPRSDADGGERERERTGARGGRGGQPTACGHDAARLSQDPADALRHGLQIAVQRGGLSETGAQAIETAAGYCGAHAWNPPDCGLLGVVDGLADRGKRIAALGDAWVPLQAAVGYRLLGGPVSA